MTKRSVLIVSMLALWLLSLPFTLQAQKIDAPTQYFPDIFVGEGVFYGMTIYNKGSAPLVISDIVYKSGDPEIQFFNSKPITIPAYDDKSLVFKFEPTQVKTYTTVFYVYSNDATVTLTLVGKGIAKSPIIILSTPSFTFSTTVVHGECKTGSPDYYNQGAAPLLVSDITHTGSQAFKYTGPTPPFEIPINGTGELIVEFCPTVGTSHTATFTIHSNDPDNPQVSMNFNGTSKPGATINDPTDVIFGNVVIGESMDKTTTITNPSDASRTLTVNSITYPAGDFEIISPAIPFDVLKGQYKTITVRFTPQTTGAKETQFTIDSNDLINNPVYFKALGSCVDKPEPYISISVGGVNVPINGTIDFGNIKQGTTTSKTLIIKNTGAAALNLQGLPVNISGTNSNQFSPKQQPQTPINPDSTTSFIIEFSPDSLGLKNANISILSDDPNQSPFPVKLKGTASDDPPPIIQITAPANNSTVNGPVTITASASSTGGVSHVKFYLDGTQLCSDSSSPYTCTWTPTIDDNGSHTIKATVFDNNNKNADDSINITVAIAAPQEPVITVISPNGYDEWPIDSPQVISWGITGTVEDVKIELNRNDGSGWTVLKSPHPVDQPFPWTVTGPTSTSCYVRVSETDGTPSDTSDNPFSIIDTTTGNSLTIGNLTLQAESVNKSGDTYTLSGSVNLNQKLWFSGIVTFTGDPDNGKGILHSAGYPYVKLSKGSEPLFGGLDYAFDLDGMAGTLMPRNLNKLVNYAMKLVNMPLQVAARPITILSTGVRIEPNLSIGNGPKQNLCTLHLQLLFRPNDRVHLEHAEVLVDASDTIEQLKATKMTLEYIGSTETLLGTASLDFPLLGMTSVQASIEVIGGCFNRFEVSVALAHGIPLGSTGLEITGLTLVVDHLCQAPDIYVFFGGNLGIKSIPDSIFSLKGMGLGYDAPARLIIESGSAEFLGYPFATLSGYIDASNDRNKAGAALRGRITFGEFFNAQVDMTLLSKQLKFNGSAKGVLQIPKMNNYVIDTVLGLPREVTKLNMDMDIAYRNRDWQGSLKGMLNLLGIDYSLTLSYDNGRFHLDVGINFIEYRIFRKRSMQTNAVIHGITLPFQKEAVLFAARGKSRQPEIQLIAPNGQTITEENINKYNTIRYVSNPRDNVAIFAVKQAAAGDWDLKVSNLSNSEVDIKVLAKRRMPRTAFAAVQKTGDNIAISSTVSAAEADTKISYYFSPRVSGGSGSPIVENLTVKNGAVSFDWDTRSISSGTYYLFSKTTDNVNPPVITYYSSALTFDRSSIVPPSALSGSRSGSIVSLKWSPSTTSSVIGYNVLYTDQTDLPGYPWQKSAAYRDHLSMENLDPAKNYRFVVVAYDALGRTSIQSNSYATPGSAGSEIWVLANGVSVSDTIQSGHMKYYKHTLPERTNHLEIKSANATGNIDLYVRKGDTPNLTRYDYRAGTESGNETITIDASNSGSQLTAGDWYIGVYAIENSSYSLTAGHSLAPGKAEIALNRNGLIFGALAYAVPPAQQVRISNKGNGTLNWTATANQSWLVCYPNSGTSSALLSINVNPTGLAHGTYTGSITISAPNAANSPSPVEVTLKVYPGNGSHQPFGQFATPVAGTTVQGSIPVTGWVLDDIGVQGVKIFRGNSANLQFIGDALFVEGARPDVQQAYPGYPMNYRAGWGYMLLTNFLPGNGNGTVTLHALATDTEGHQVTLGTKTITCDNAHAVKPFGAIDTPAQGGIASGNSFINWGWVLTPQPNAIPLDGSTIDVWVDGVKIGHPNYNIYRSDIAALFPGYANSNGAIGYFVLNTNTYTDGLHTIQWTVRDNAGNSDGIGSRYFSIQNGNARTRESVTHDVLSENPHLLGEPHPDLPGTNLIEIRELEPIQIHVGKRYTRGCLLVGQLIRPLPTGSYFNAGTFYWMPGAGFVGQYDFLFINHLNNSLHKRVRIRVKPKTGNLE